MFVGLDGLIAATMVMVRLMALTVAVTVVARQNRGRICKASAGRIARGKRKRHNEQ